MKDMAIAVGVAVATMTLTLMLFWPAGLSAVDSPKGPAGILNPPTLAAEGCRVSVRSAQEKYKPDGLANLELTVVNTTDKTVTLTALLRMSATAKASPMSRMEPAAREIWHGEFPLTLEPGQSCVVPILPQAKLTAGSTVSVSLTVGKETIQAAGFAVDGAEKAPPKVPSVKAGAAQSPGK